MQTVTEYFAMGGYAGFVWSAYGLSLVVLVGLLVVSRRALRAREAEVAALEAASPRRRPADEEVPS